MPSRLPLLLRLAAVAVIAAAPLTAPLFGRPAVRAQVSDRLCSVDETALALDALEQDMLGRINGYRQSNGLGALQPSTVLVRAAQWKSTARAGGGPENHDDADRTWDQRIVDCGYDQFALMGENMGKVGGNPTDENGGLFIAWQNSTTHNEAMLHADFRAIGLARVVDAAGVSYWTAVFGSLLDTELPAAVPQEMPADEPAAEPAPQPEPEPAPEQPQPEPEPEQPQE